MKAVLVDQESNLSWGEADRPQINADEILVRSMLRRLTVQT